MRRCLNFAILLIATYILPLIGFAQESSEDTRRHQSLSRELMDNQQMMMKLMNIASNSELRKDLELIDDQLEELKDISAEFQQSLSNPKYIERSMEIRRAIDAGDDKEARRIGAELQSDMLKVSRNLKLKLKETLLPHQLSRMKQIARKSSLARKSEYKDEFGIAMALSDELELNKEEKAKLKRITEQAREEYYDELENLKRKTHKKILAALPRKKRDHLVELVGDLFKPQEKKSSK